MGGGAKEISPATLCVPEAPFTQTGVTDKLKSAMMGHEDKPEATDSTGPRTK